MQKTMMQIPAVAAIAVLALLPPLVMAQQEDPFASAYAANCSTCHGERMEGAAQGTPLLGVALKRGDSMEQLMRSINEGSPSTGMPAFGKTLDAMTVRRIASFVAEKRANLAYDDFRIAAPPALPADRIQSGGHTFRVEQVADGIDRLPYAIAPLPDGSILVSEKTRGLRIVSADGKLSGLVRGTPQAFDDGFEVPGVRLVYGQGYLMDLAPHPDHARNGWIYLHYSERCSDCNQASRATGRPVSMNRIVRGRIRDGEWVDQQDIWRADIESYTPMPDMAAGGRLAFDDAGHLFFSVGVKGGSEGAGVQDLSQPFGKIHRVNDDGSIPADNPFVGVAGALQTIWTLGHRTPQGLEFDRRTGQLWETEMGPRGGDEVNLLTRGGNYGWPVYSKGINYDGTALDWGAQLGIRLEEARTVQPLVDLTPSPAVASFAIYQGDAFPQWQQDLIVGTLKATELYRMVREGGRIVRVEKLLSGLGRIRDVAVDAHGRVLLLLEHASGSRIVRLVPESDSR